MPPSQQQNYQHLPAHVERPRLTSAAQQQIERVNKVIAQLEAKDKQVRRNQEIMGLKDQRAESRLSDPLNSALLASDFLDLTHPFRGEAVPAPASIPTRIVCVLPAASPRGPVRPRMLVRGCPVPGPEKNPGRTPGRRASHHQWSGSVRFRKLHSR